MSISDFSLKTKLHVRNKVQASYGVGEQANMWMVTLIYLCDIFICMFIAINEFLFNKSYLWIFLIYAKDLTKVWGLLNYVRHKLIFLS